MCGIALVKTSDADSAWSALAIRELGQALSHRGPDALLYHSFSQGGNHFQLAYARLRISDTRPESDQILFGDLPLLFNGELYDTPSGQLDTQRLAQAISQGQLGPNLNQTFPAAMGAALWVANGQVHHTRDQHGIKPLYHWSEGPREAWSSELMPLARLFPSLAHRLRQVPLFAHGQRFTGLSWSASEDLPQIYLQALAEARTLATLPHRAEIPLEEALWSQIPTQVPYGILLSGGMDSSWIAALAARHPHKPAHTFSIVEAGADTRQHPARRVAQSLGLDWQPIPLALKDFLADWPAYSATMDVPIADMAGYLTWKVAQAAQQKGLKVLLSGAGADELMGGYRRHQALLLSEKYPWQVLSPLLPWLPEEGKRMVWGSGLSPAGRFEAWQRMAGSPPAPPTLTGPLTVTEACRLDRLTYLRGDILTLSDRASSAWGIELRVPFLDTSVVQSLAAWPEKAFLAEILGKKPLVSRLESLRLGWVARQKKSGFGLRQALWWRQAESLPLWQGLLDSPPPGYEARQIRALWKAHKTHKADLSARIYAMLVAQAWHRQLPSSET